MVIHYEEALYQVYAPYLTLPYLRGLVETAGGNEFVSPYTAVSAGMTSPVW